MREFSAARRRLAEYRICLERDVAAGLIPAPAFVAVDACYASLSTMLESARVKLEAAGPEVQQEAFATRCAGGWTRLARHMFAAMYRQRDPAELERVAAEISGKSRALMECLWRYVAAVSVADAQSRRQRMSAPGGAVRAMCSAICGRMRWL